MATDERTAYFSDLAGWPQHWWATGGMRATSGPTEALIWAGEGTPPTDGRLTICWSGREEGEGLISLLQEAEHRSDRLRSAYCEWVDLVGRGKVGGRTVVEHLKVDHLLSHWWFTLLVERNPLKTAAVSEGIRLLALEEVLSEVSVDAVEFSGGTVPVRKAVEGLCRELRISVRFTGRPVRSTRPRRWGLLSGQVRGLVVLFRHLWFRRRIVRRPSTIGHFTPGAVVLVGQLFGVVTREDGSCESNLWPGLDRLTEEAGLRLNRLHRFVPSRALPKQGAAICLVQSEANRWGAGATDLLLSSLDRRVLWRTLRRWHRLGRVARKVQGGSSTPGDVEVRRWLWAIHSSDWGESLVGGVGMLGCLESVLVDHVFGSMPKQQLGVCAIEFHPWERAVFDAWQRHGHGTLIGYVHAATPFWDLRYHRGEREWSGSRGLVPDLVAVNGEGTRESLAEGGVPTDRLISVEALRYLHIGQMAELSGDDLKGRAVGDPMRLLVLTEYLEGSTEAILDLVTEAIDGIDVEVRHRPHPGSPTMGSAGRWWFAEAAKGSMSEEIALADVVIAGGWTSAGVEAFQAGVPTVVVLDDDDLVHSPLRGRTGVELVSTPAELRAFLDDPVKAGGDSRFFHVDLGLPRWRGLFAAYGTSGGVAEAFRGMEDRQD